MFHVPNRVVLGKLAKLKTLLSFIQTPCKKIEIIRFRSILNSKYLLKYLEFKIDIKSNRIGWDSKRQKGKRLRSFTVSGHCCTCWYVDVVPTSSRGLERIRGWGSTQGARSCAIFHQDHVTTTWIATFGKFLFHRVLRLSRFLFIWHETIFRI